MTELDGKTIIVTWAASGIGAAVVSVLGYVGANVIAADIAEGAARRLNETSPAGWGDLIMSLEEIDGLVSAAGVTHGARIASIAEADFNRVMAVNALGPLHGMQGGRAAHAPGRLDRQHLLARRAHRPLYSRVHRPAEGALRGLSRAASMELGVCGIRVNAVFPGYIETAMTASAPAALRAAGVEAAPLGRPGHPEEAAQSCAPGACPAQPPTSTALRSRLTGKPGAPGGAKFLSDALQPSVRPGLTRDR